MIQFLGTATRNNYYQILYVFPADTTVLQFTVTAMENGEFGWSIGNHNGSSPVLTGAAAGTPFPVSASYVYSGPALNVVAGDRFVILCDFPISVVMETSEVASVPVTTKRKFSSYTVSAQIPRCISHRYLSFDLYENQWVFCLPALASGNIIVSELYIQASFAHRYDADNELEALSNFMLAQRPKDYESETDDLSFPLPRHWGDLHEGTPNLEMATYSESDGLHTIYISPNPVPAVQLLDHPVTIFAGENFQIGFKEPNGAVYTRRSHGYMNVHINAYKAS